MERNRRNKIGLEDFFGMMECVVSEIKKNDFKVFHVPIEKFRQKDAMAHSFEIDDLEELKQNPMEIEKEVDKLVVLCGIMLKLLFPNEIVDDKEYLSFVGRLENLDTVMEVKNLIRQCYNPMSIMNLKMFILKIHEYYAIVTRKKEENEDMVEYQICSFCYKRNLQPMHELKGCGCFYHIPCLESEILDSIQLKVLKSAPIHKSICRNKENHLFTYDLILISEVQKAGYSLKRSIISLIQYYYANQNCAAKCSESCKEKDMHRIVSSQTKKPYELPCNHKCSFCNQKPHEICPRFIGSLKNSE